jgi:hypothetical protein
VADSLQLQFEQGSAIKTASDKGADMARKRRGGSAINAATVEQSSVRSTADVGAGASMLLDARCEMRDARCEVGVGYAGQRYP